MDEIFLSILICGCLISLVFVIASSIKDFYFASTKHKNNLNNENNVMFEPEYKTKVNATVIDQHCGVRTIGYKTFKTIKEFMVVFQTENGDVLELYVPEEAYLAFEHGQKGLLTLIV